MSNIQQIRQSIHQFVKRASEKHQAKRILDVAPDEWAVVPQFYKENVTTLNITEGCDIKADICDCPQVASGSFDMIFCLEVLEHVYEPFKAVSELFRLLDTGGLLFISVPMFFEIHVPYPDCWRFTEMGLRYMFREHEVIEFNSVHPGPAPLHYTMVIRK